MVEPTASLIEAVKIKIIETYNPLEIYIFGSYAWGVPNKDSDLDILIVIDELTKDRHRHLVDGYLALWKIRVAKDILLYTKEEFEEDASDDMTLCYKVKSEGKQIYTKA